jgi:Holliday junction resolvasome RuvABC DNA-binding subunit
MRSSGQWQERQLREFTLLRQEMRTARRHDLLALSGVGAGIALATLSHGSGHSLAIAVGVLLVFASVAWRLAAG